ncbi:hypothetical protein [Catenuloplanes indicus]|uniref:Lipoprotein n=1 Tax=Catenuloplanes indicus TaxID=137267 RepID=A0AAE4B405_9ACTN|nr:hypothetical protein [Catenuloplanes indicus]MDQ0370803.1 hypothetical protein [Catenuloplanes indicus]
MSRGHIAALAAIIIALSGCSGAAGAPQPAASSAAALPDPAAALAASVTALDQLDYEFKLASPYDGDISGVVHAPTGSLELEQRARFRDGGMSDVRYRGVGDEKWLRIDFSQFPDVPGDLPGGLTGRMWLPAAGISNGTEFGALRLIGPEKRLTGVESLVGAVVTVTRKGTASFEGTVDVTAAGPGTLGFGLAQDHVTALGDRARSLPFRATTDHQGRLRQFGFEYPAAGDRPAGGVSFSFDQYDAARPAGAPAGGELGSAADLAAALAAFRALQQR